MDEHDKHEQNQSIYMDEINFILMMGGNQTIELKIRVCPMRYMERFETKSHSLDGTIELSFIDLGLQPNLGMGEITIKRVKKDLLAEQV